MTNIEERIKEKEDLLKTLDKNENNYHFLSGQLTILRELLKIKCSNCKNQHSCFKVIKYKNHMGSYNYDYKSITYCSDFEMKDEGK